MNPWCFSTSNLFVGTYIKLRCWEVERYWHWYIAWRNVICHPTNFYNPTVMLFHVKYIINHYRRVKQEGWRWACASSNRRRLGIRGMLFELSNRRSLDTVIPCVLSNRILYESSNRKSSTAMPYESSNTNRKKLEVNLSTSPHCCHNSLKRLTRFVILVSLSPKPCSDPNSKTWRPIEQSAIKVLGTPKMHF